MILVIHQRLVISNSGSVWLSYEHATGKMSPHLIV